MRPEKQKTHLAPIYECTQKLSFKKLKYRSKHRPPQKYLSSADKTHQNPYTNTESNKKNLFFKSLPNISNL